MQWESYNKTLLIKTLLDSTQFKIYWLGPRYLEAGQDGNDIRRTNVPDIRVSYRHETLQAELQMLVEALEANNTKSSSDVGSL